MTAIGVVGPELLSPNRNIPVEDGFTDHHGSMISALVYMAGRVNDALVGRSLSPDTNIQAPSSTQTFDR